MADNNPIRRRPPLSSNGVSVQGALKKRLTAAQREAFDNLIRKEESYDNKIKELNAVREVLDAKLVELAQTQALLEAERIEAAKKMEVFEKQYQESLNLETQLADLKSKITTSYAPSDISDYLNQIIRDFNESSVSDGDMATYIINNMDVDLKVRIFSQQNSADGEQKAPQIRFTAPEISETSEDSLSSIKITIQAIPK